MEFDVQLSKDKIVVVYHDYTVCLTLKKVCSCDAICLNVTLIACSFRMLSDKVIPRPNTKFWICTDVFTERHWGTRVLRDTCDGFEFAAATSSQNKPSSRTEQPARFVMFSVLKWCACCLNNYWEMIGKYFSDRESCKFDCTYI